MLRRLVQVAGDLPCDLIALEYTRHLAGLYQARVHLTTVLGPAAPRDDPSAPIHCRRFYYDFVSSAEMRLKADGVPLSTELISGEIGLEAIRVADLADLIVLGLPEAENTDTESRYRIYLAKQLCKQVSRSLLLARGSPVALRRVLVAYDGSVDAGHALRLGADWAEKVNAVLHVVVATEGRDRWLIGSHYLGAQVYLEAYRVTVVPHLSPLRPEPALLKAAREHHVDLIVLGATGRGDMAEVVFDHATEQIIAQAPCAILIAQ
jgi:nucleotide-binding universal stress UspA family protein